MNAALLMRPGRIELVQVPRPACPEGGLLLKVAACGVCGSDIRAYHGRKQITQKHAVAGQTLPGHIIGHEIAGTVEAVGSGVASFHPGELVTVAPSITCGTCDACRRGQSTVCRSYQALGWQYPGGFAEYVAVPPRLLHDGSVNRIPEGVPAWKACLAEPLACAIHAQDAMGAGPGDSVLVVGAGPMGCLNLLLARQRGATFVAVTDPNACRRDLVKALGADLAVDSNAIDMIQGLLDGTGGQGFSVVIFAVSSIKPIRDVLGAMDGGTYRLLAPGSRVNVFSGLDPGDTSMTLDARVIFYQGISLICSVNSAPRHNAQALDLIARGAIDVTPLVTARLPLSRAADAFQLVLSRPRVHQKAVIEP
jgi:L-iditol 2-dehydrogenase